MEFANNNKYKKQYWPKSVNKLPVNKNATDISPENCICNRKRGLVFCNCCQKSFVGRIGERCQAHPEIAYLMDSRNCAYCGAAVIYLKMVDQA